MTDPGWFGGRLRELREAAGLTQMQLAGKAGMNQYGVAKLEQGVSKPSWESALRLAGALGVTLDDLAARPGLRKKDPPKRPRGRPRKPKP